MFVEEIKEINENGGAEIYFINIDGTINLEDIGEIFYQDELIHKKKLEFDKELLSILKEKN